MKVDIGRVGFAHSNLYGIVSLVNKSVGRTWRSCNSELQKASSIPLLITLIIKENNYVVHSLQARREWCEGKVDMFLPLPHYPHCYMIVVMWSSNVEWDQERKKEMKERKRSLGHHRREKWTSTCSQLFTPLHSAHCYAIVIVTVLRQWQWRKRKAFIVLPLRGVIGEGGPSRK